MTEDHAHPPRKVEHMRTRIITAVVALAAFIPVLIFSHTWAFPIAMAILSAIGAVEMLACIGMKKWHLTSLTLIVAAAFPVLARVFGASENFMPVFVAVFFCYLIIILALCVFSKGKYDVGEAGISFTMVFYVAASFTSIVLLRDCEIGAYLYLLAFLGPWMSDSAAYFCGRAFGRHKLIPDVSPKKTVEGSIGGIIFTGIAFAVYGAFTLVGENGGVLSYVILFIMGALTSGVSQIGDLIASLIKRKYGIKDYGKLFPGHGGVMDRFDSVLITSPVLLIIAELAVKYSLF